MKAVIDINKRVVKGLLPLNATKKYIDTIGEYVIDIDEDSITYEEVINPDGLLVNIPKFRALEYEELYPFLVTEWKKQRQVLVDNIEVTYNNVTYQGDEKSQDRMSRALNGMPDESTINWKAKDNTTQVLSKADLKEILHMAGQEQTRIWFENEPTLGA